MGTVICDVCKNPIKYNVYKLRYDVPLSFCNERASANLCCSCMRKINRFVSGSVEKNEHSNYLGRKSAR